MYRPLPDCLRVGESKIEGVGIFATEEIAAGCNLGATHYPRAGQPHGYIRTPLGGFINHANEANCVKVELRDEAYTKKWSLVALRDIKKGEELTLRYTFYNI